MSSSTFSFLCVLLDTHDPYPFTPPASPSPASPPASPSPPSPSASPSPSPSSSSSPATSPASSLPTFASSSPLPLPPPLPLFPSSRTALTRTPHSQILADSSRILFVATSFIPSRTDASLLKCSSLFTKRMLSPNDFFVSEGNYPLLPWLILPYPDTCLSDELAFNEVHREMCRPVRRAVASFRKWGVMERLEEEDKKMVVACVGTCAILHNVLLMREDYSALAPEEEVDWEAKGGRKGCGAERVG